MSGIRLFFFNIYGYYLNEDPMDDPNIKFKIVYFFKWKLSYYFYRTLSLFRILPSIDFYFESSEERLIKINSLKNKIHKLFNFVNFAYFKKIKRINSIYYDDLLVEKIKNSKKNIVLIDSGLSHPDAKIKDPDYKKITDQEINHYYLKIINKLKLFSKKNKYKIYFCKHPKTYYPKDCFKNFKNIKFNFGADKHIFSAKYVFFNGGTSMINKAILLKKDFFILKSKQTQRFGLRLLESINSIFKLNYINIEDSALAGNTSISKYREKKNMINLLLKT